MKKYIGTSVVIYNNSNEPSIDISGLESEIHKKNIKDIISDQTLYKYTDRDIYEKSLKELEELESQRRNVNFFLHPIIATDLDYKIHSIRYKLYGNSPFYVSDDSLGGKKFNEETENSIIRFNLIRKYLTDNQFILSYHDQTYNTYYYKKDGFNSKL